MNYPIAIEYCGFSGSTGRERDLRLAGLNQMQAKLDFYRRGLLKEGLKAAKPDIKAMADPERLIELGSQTLPEVYREYIGLLKARDETLAFLRNRDMYYYRRV